MSTTETEWPEGVVVERFLKRCTSRYMGMAGRPGRRYIKMQYGLFFRAAIVVQLDDGRRVRGYITNAYETTTDAKARAVDVQVGDRVRVTCKIAQFARYDHEQMKRVPTRTWIPISTARGFITFTRLTVPSTTTT